MPAIQLTPAQRKEHRAEAHHLDPVVLIGSDGLTPAVSAPVVILNGNDDSIATVAQSEDILSLLDSVPSKVLYVAQKDTYGRPKISPNHGAPLDDIKGLPDHLKFFNISGELDVLDYRYYFAGLDAVMDGGRDGLVFDLGTWSNGRPVKPVLEFH